MIVIRKNNNNEGQKTAKSIRMDNIQWDLIKGLVPFYGSTEAEVVRNIVLMWLNENIGSKTIEKLEELNAINLKKKRLER